jgi:RNA polymerase sigma-70 factor (ECF subfamily)
VPISEQDTRAWNHELLAEAARLLSMAVKHRRPGRFQLEAAIQSAHVERMRTGSLDWAAIADLYEGLVQLAPTFGALLGRAAAVAEAHGAAAGLALLDRIPEQDVEQHQPYWAVRAHLLHALGREEAARHALDRALHLTDDDSVRRFLERKFA